ncbi:hypothetical protein [Janthinobacterium sp.]|uniref:hypothetical protein n=1 Tax=Janthinobacterium sp. TaxID=1871054 RepID=UPI002628F35D|nr:hypothetical protein [Janthinobacterium sp.]
MAQAQATKYDLAGISDDLRRHPLNYMARLLEYYEVSITESINPKQFSLRQ